MFGGFDFFRRAGEGAAAPIDNSLKFPRVFVSVSVAALFEFLPYPFDVFHSAKYFSIS